MGQHVPSCQGAGLQRLRADNQQLVQGWGAGVWGLLGFGPAPRCAGPSSLLPDPIAAECLGLTRSRML